MPYRNYEFTATVTAGGAGTATTNGVVAGVVRAVHFNYSGTATTTDVALMPAHYSGTIISSANTITDGWLYPSIALNDGTAGARTAYDGVPIVDNLKLTVAQATAGDTVTATVVVEY